LFHDQLTEKKSFSRGLKSKNLQVLAFLGPGYDGESFTKYILHAQDMFISVNDVDLIDAQSVGRDFHAKLALEARS
jgi:type II secretory pathway component PulC